MIVKTFSSRCQTCTPNFCCFLFIFNSPYKFHVLCSKHKALNGQMANKHSTKSINIYYWHIAMRQWLIHLAKWMNEWIIMNEAKKELIKRNLCLWYNKDNRISMKLSNCNVARRTSKCLCTSIPFSTDDDRTKYRRIVRSLFHSFILMIRAFMQIHDLASCSAFHSNRNWSEQQIIISLFLKENIVNFRFYHPEKGLQFAENIWRKMLSIEIPLGNPCIRIPFRFGNNGCCTVHCANKAQHANNDKPHQILRKPNAG